MTQATETPWGMSFVVYNPHSKPIEELPYIFGFNNGGPEDFLIGCLVSQDGKFLGSHCCSDEAFMYGDLAIVEGGNPQRHEGFQKHYPDGYRMTFVSYKDVKTNEELQAAMTIFVASQQLVAEQRENNAD